MTSTAAILPAPTTPRATAHPMAPILIQVPALRSPRRPMRRRRRLRREVRICVVTLLLCAPPAYLALGALDLWPRSAGAVTADAVPPLSVRLFAPEQESGTWGGGTDSEGPVVVPTGYLLPEMIDEPQEDAAHAGT